MLGIDYASGSDEELQTTAVSPQGSIVGPSSMLTRTVSSSSTATTTIIGVGPSIKPTSTSVGSCLKLPPLSNASVATASKTTTTSGGLSLPPKSRKVTGTKKIRLQLPRLEKKHGNDEDEGGLSDDEASVPAVKKSRLNGSRPAGASSLLSMLPAPKRSIPRTSPTPQRVLGGGKLGVMYSAASAAKPEEKANPILVDVEDEADEEDQRPERAYAELSVKSLLPPSLQLGGKGKAKEKMNQGLGPSGASKEDPQAAMDFFSLGATPSTTPTPHLLQSTPTSTPLYPTPLFPSFTQFISSAPDIADFHPPSPKIDDPYPGYYQLPSGTWAMHDPAVYQTYVERWRREYDAHIKQLEASARAGTCAGIGTRFSGSGGFGTGLDAEEPTEIRASELADAARAAREEKKSLTRHAGREVDRPVPKVALNPSKTGGLARTRHQLHSLLTDAYLNREALEDKIAQGKRNRKEAGNKYGF